MSSVLGFIFDAAGVIVPLALSDAFKPHVPQEAKTNVQIIIGHGSSTAGGTVPHIALWDDDGNRIGQFHPDGDEKIGNGDVKTITIDHSQTVPKYSQADPYYVLVSQLSDDATCIAAITVANSKISGAFYGDTGYKCGQSWFASDNRIGSDFWKPKCVWLDANHDNGINARALSFHLNDMQANDAKLDEYYENLDALCKSTPRFSFWGNLLPDGIIPFFNPKLEYKDDNGADVDLSKVLDDPNHPFDKSVYLHQGEKKASRARSAKTRRTPRGANHDPSHLIISDQDTDVREICNHPNSYGWDIVSTQQGVFCDMEHKQLYPLCGGGIASNCFSLNSTTLIGEQTIARDESAMKLRFGRSYNTTAHWGKM
ncbi:hypothetical protein FHL15_005734 [Xylaria flabelliformis]|uniref:Uncharacterized protein n=1 Tax=Xylaria flabelliformis TaxID=2512241 RepID=A0A553HZT6_9PEZI|nr:hypothetical protein FHL15_005734 [Xylaria flabelliformis]